MRLVYKIMGAADWAAALASGAVAPAPIDVKDGYIHLSAEDQVLETARRHFAGRGDLVAVAFNADAFGFALMWEASRSGALFPHLYAELPATKAVRSRRLDPDGSGGFRFGDDL